MKRRGSDRFTTPVAPKSLAQQLEPEPRFQNPRFAALAAGAAMLVLLAVPAVVTLTSLGDAETAVEAPVVAAQDGPSPAVAEAPPQAEQITIAADKPVAPSAPVAQASVTEQQANTDGGAAGAGVESDRWARDAKPAQQTASARRAEAGESLTDSGPLGYADNSAEDQTASIGSGPDAAKLKFEAGRDAVAWPGDGKDAEPKGEQPAQQSASQDDGLAPASARSAVNLRAGPSTGAKVLTVVPANADLRAEPNCRHWCKVEFNGTSGFIYKSFIRHDG